MDGTLLGFRSVLLPLPRHPLALSELGSGGKGVGISGLADILGAEQSCPPGSEASHIVLLLELKLAFASGPLSLAPGFPFVLCGPAVTAGLGEPVGDTVQAPRFTLRRGGGP